MKIMMSFLLFQTLYCNMNNDDCVIIHFRFMCFKWLNCLDSTIVKTFWKVFSIWKTIWIYNAKSLKRWCRFANCLFAQRWQNVETSSTIRLMIFANDDVYYELKKTKNLIIFLFKSKLIIVKSYCVFYYVEKFIAY